MKEALIDSSLSVTIHDAPIPTPGPHQVLIRVVVSGSNPKDWKVPKVFGQNEPPKNHGDDIAGYVEAVGEGVAQFRKGDRVAAFHEMMTAHGSYAEFAIAWEGSTFHVPGGTSFEGGYRSYLLVQWWNADLVCRSCNAPAGCHDGCLGAVSAP